MMKRLTLFVLSLTGHFLFVQSFTFTDFQPLFVHDGRRSASLHMAAEIGADLKAQIVEEIKGTKRGLSVTNEKKSKINSLVQELESKCPFPEPARSPLMGGKWIVDYTTAPPPSNGKLGPFEGIARQIIDLDAGTYTNYLSVPGEIDKEWLSARLEATFEEWDGVLLKDDRSSSDEVEIEQGSSFREKASDSVGTPELGWFDSIISIFNTDSNNSNTPTLSPDYGKENWKVDFKTLTIKIFGFPIVQKTFDEGTSRVWKMSYLDGDGTRIVRAGRTGKDDDAMLFYMSRDN